MNQPTENQINGVYYIAIRFDAPSQREFASLDTLRCSAAGARNEAKDEDVLAPKLAAYWPVVRIARVKLTEVPE